MFRMFSLAGTLGCGLVLATLASPGTADAAGFKTLYAFCTETNCTDGNEPVAGLIMDTKGNVYGTTNEGGAHGYGTVFKVGPGGKETVLYSFCSVSNCTDGALPVTDLVRDTKGNFYGTTTGGGADGDGTVFKVSPGGKETVLYSFCAKANCSDGRRPQAGLFIDTAGNLYGTALYGGQSTICSDGGFGCGIVFKVSPGGKETVLYNFCRKAKCSDGAFPSSSLIMDGNGNLYGSTQSAARIRLPTFAAITDAAQSSN